MFQIPVAGLAVRRGGFCRTPAIVLEWRFRGGTETGRHTDGWIWPGLLILHILKTAIHKFKGVVHTLKNSKLCNLLSNDNKLGTIQ